MHLTNPSALWYLILLAIPPLLARRPAPRPRQAVANLYLWQAIARRDEARLSLRHVRRNWLVALQVALMAAIIVAMAGPVVAFRPSRVAVVFDVSMSMGARDGDSTRLGLARTRARAILGGLPRDTAVRLVLAGAWPRDLGELPAGSPGLDRALEALVPTAGPADLPAAIRLAAAGDGGGGQFTYVFSDRAGRDAAGRMDSPGLPVNWTDVGRSADNLALARIAMRRHPLDTAGGQVLAEVRNFGPTARDADVELEQDGQVLGRQRIQVPPYGAQTIRVDIARLGRIVSARVLTGDALDLDNRRLAVVPALHRVRVRLITSGSFFLEKVLAANPWIDLETVPYANGPNPAGAGPRNAGDRAPEVVVCDGCSEPPGRDEAVLVISPPAESLGPAALTVSQPGHPVLAAFEPGGVFVTPTASALRPEAGDVILRAGGVPVAIARQREGRRMLELRLDVAAPELALSTGFPILVANAIDWLAARDENSLDLVSGEPLRWLLPAAYAADRVSVSGPDGRPVRSQLQGRYLTLADTGVAGPYRVRTPAGDQLFVVNPAVNGESDLTAAGADTAPAWPGDRAQSGLSQREIAPLLVLLALGLLAAEWRYRWTWDGRSS